jgi:hypothetical protein
MKIVQVVTVIMMGVMCTLSFCKLSRVEYLVIDIHSISSVERVNSSTHPTMSQQNETTIVRLPLESNSTHTPIASTTIVAPILDDIPVIITDAVHVTDTMDTATTTYNNNTTTTTTTTNNATQLWIPVPPDEVQLYIPCYHAFQHCCIGQNRNYFDRRNDTAPLLVQWHTPLRNMTHVLESLHAQQKQTEDGFCNVWFIGDSTTSDYFMGALCELTRINGYEIVDCHPIFGNSGWRENPVCTRLGNQQKRKYHFAHVWLQHPQASSHGTICPNVILRLDYTLRLDELKVYEPRDAAEQDFFHQGGVAIWSWGAHCHQQGCITAAMHTHFAPFVQAHAAHWKIQWREMEPQHFRATDYTWHTILDRRAPRYCVPHKPQSTPYNTYENAEAAAFLTAFNHNNSQHNASIPLIPYIPLMDAMAPRWDFHSDTPGDCTHYVYTPWRFLVLWDRMVQAMEAPATMIPPPLIMA